MDSGNCADGLLSINLLRLTDPNRIAVRIQPSATTQDLHNAASLATGIPQELLRLVYRGQEIPNDESQQVTGARFRVSDGCCIHCLKRYHTQVTSNQKTKPIRNPAAEASLPEHSEASAAEASATSAAAPPAAPSAAVAASALNRIVKATENPKDESKESGAGAAEKTNSKITPSCDSKQQSWQFQPPMDKDTPSLMAVPDKALLMAIYNEEWGLARYFLQSEDKLRLADYRDSSGNFALQYAACKAETPEDVLKSLFSLRTGACLQKTKSGEMPVFGVSDLRLMRILETCPEMALVSNIDGDTPLVFAIGQRRSAVVIHKLLQLAPDMAVTANKKGETPLAYFFRIWGPVIGHYNKADGDTGESSEVTWARLDNIFRQQLRQDSRIRNYYDSHLFSGLWDVLSYVAEVGELLLRVAVQGSVVADETAREHRWHVLHAALCIDECPWSFCWFMLQRDPRQIQMKDESGNLPLHLVCASRTKRDEDFKSLLTLLLQRNPAAVFEVNNDGNLPLHMAGLSRQPLQDSGLERVLKLFPNAMSVKNNKGRTPFHLAVLTRQELEQSKLDRASLVFDLILQNPCVLDVACSEYERPQKKRRIET